MAQALGILFRFLQAVFRPVPGQCARRKNRQASARRFIRVNPIDRSCTGVLSGLFPDHRAGTQLWRITVQGFGQSETTSGFPSFISTV